MAVIRRREFLKDVTIAGAGLAVFGSVASDKKDPEIGILERKTFGDAAVTVEHRYSSGIGYNFSLSNAREILSDIAETAMERCRPEKGPENMLIINEIMNQKPKFNTGKNVMLLGEALDSKMLDCDVSCFIHLDVGEKLREKMDFPISLAKTRTWSPDKYHCYLIWNGSDGTRKSFHPNWSEFMDDAVWEKYNSRTELDYGFFMSGMSREEAFSEIYYNIGSCYYAHRNYEVAERLFRKAISLNKKNLLAWYGHSLPLGVMKRYEEATFNAMVAAESGIPLHTDFYNKLKDYITRMQV